MKLAAVLWLNIILCIVEAIPVHEPLFEYLYTRRDGIAYMEVISMPKIDAENRTIYFRKENPILSNLSSTAFELKSLRFGQNGIPKSARGGNNHDQVFFRGSSGVIDKQLEILQTLVKPDEVSQCTHGPNKFVDCNHCVCMGGQVYVCTSRKCVDHENHKLTAFRKNTNCIEGQLIRSYDRCNRCYCGGGEIICTRNKCIDDEDQTNQKECNPGEKIPSPDGCNSCACNTQAMIVCTTHTCGPELAPDIRDQVCRPNTWYSIAGNPKCRDCYCINGKMSFCYMNLCTSAGKSSNTHVMLKLSLPGSLPDHCVKTDYMQDRCTRCFCTKNGLWSCQTRDLSGSCATDTSEKWTRPGGNRGTTTQHEQNKHHGYNGYVDDSGEEWNPKSPKRPNGNYGNGGRPNGNHGNGGRPNGIHGNGGRPNGIHGNGGRPNGYHENEGRPNGNHGNAGKPNANHGNGGRPNGYHGNKGRPNGNHGNGERPNGNHGNRGRPNGHHGNEGRPNGNHVNGGNPNGSQGNGGRPNGNYGNQGRPNANHGNGGRPNGNHGHGERPNDYYDNEGRPNYNHGNGGKPNDSHDNEERPNDYHENEGRPNDYNENDGRPNDIHENGERPNGNHRDGGEEWSEKETKHPNGSFEEGGKWPGQEDPIVDHEGDYNEGPGVNESYAGFNAKGGIGTGDDANDAEWMIPTEFPNIIESHVNSLNNPQIFDEFGPEQGFDTNVDTGPVCQVGQYFTQGSATNCQGCFCTMTSEWRCWNVKGPCRGYPVHTCNPGKLKKNPRTPCSVCYCGADKTSYCATDEQCSYNLRPTQCEALTCLQHCGNSNANFGVCHNNECICVQ